MVFGLDDAMMISAGIGAISNLGGGLISSGGQASANAQNVQMQNMYNQQMMNAQNAQHAQNTAFMEDQQAASIYQQDMAQQFNSGEAAKARAFNASEAATARDVQNQFQERMASTQYQRAMSDMRAAGLNPILAYKMGGNAAPAGGGQAASGPAASGSAGSAATASAAGPPSLHAPIVQNTQLEVGRALGNMVNSATDLLKSFTGMQQVEAQTANVSIDTDKKKSELKKINAETIRTAAETHKTESETANILTQNKMLVAQGYTAEEITKMTALQVQNLIRYGRLEAPDTQERILRDLQKFLESGNFSPAALKKLIDDNARGPVNEPMIDRPRGLLRDRTGIDTRKP